MVKLELQGACGSCPSSTMTMKMGLERRLREKIPEISEVCILAGWREKRSVLSEGKEKCVHQLASHPPALIPPPLLFTHNTKSQVIQAMPEGPALTTENIDGVLEGVRPFLMVAGGSISVKEISGLGGLQPRVLLHMEGNNQSLFSVRMEITQRILRNFMVAGLRVDWSDQEGML